MKGAIIFLTWLAAATVAVAQDPQGSLSAAKDLYASAAYEDALSTLTRLQESSAAPEVAQQVDQYRVFCLLALGRTTEAESVAESLVRRDPLRQIDAIEAAPRIEAMFTAVRKRLLPGLIRERYRTARTAIEQKDFAVADTRLKEVRGMLDAATKVGASNETLDDLDIVVDGLLDLTRAAADLRVAGKAAEPAPSTSGSGSVSKSEPSGPSTSGPTIYDDTDADVTPPVVISQRAPSTSSSSLLAGIMSKVRKTGTITVTIDEKGTVEQAVLMESVHPLYDQLLTSAALTWKYRPAMKAGVPVKYRKTVRVEVTKE